MNLLRTVTLVFVFALMLGGCYVHPGHYGHHPGFVDNWIIEPVSPGPFPVYTGNIRSLPYGVRHYGATPVYRVYNSRYYQTYPVSVHHDRSNIFQGSGNNGNGFQGANNRGGFQGPGVRGAAADMAGRLSEMANDVRGGREP